MEHYNKVVGRVDATRKSILEVGRFWPRMDGPVDERVALRGALTCAVRFWRQVGKQFASKAAKARNRKEAAAVEEEGLEALQALYKKVRRPGRAGRHAARGG